jgi:ribosomal protein S18 acetylase RimI-like enzyme
MQGPMVQRLTKRVKGELTEVVARAFEQHPMVAGLGGGGGEPAVLVKALVDFHWGRDSLLVYGIRTDEGLACAGLCVDLREDPSPLALMRLAWNVSRAAGREAVGQLLDVEGRKPTYRERLLELVMMGTLPKHQRQGFGRTLLHTLYEEAVREGYRGVVLVTDRDTPAFGLYRSEGFEVENEFRVGKQNLRWMRRTV